MRDHPMTVPALLIAACVLVLCVPSTATLAGGEVAASGASKKVCLFLHGLGRMTEGVAGHLKDPNAKARSYVGYATGYKDGPMLWTGDQVAYWGDLRTDAALQATCTMRFFFTDAKTRGWNSAALQHEYCKAIKDAKADIVFAHSMGNLVLAAALQKLEKGQDAAALSGCAGIRDDSVKWIDLQGPLQGSRAADALEKICAGVKDDSLYNYKRLTTWEWSKVKTAEGSLGGFCVYDKIYHVTGRVGGGVQSLTTAVAKPAKLHETAAKYADGGFCGNATANKGCCDDDRGVGVFGGHVMLHIFARLISFNEATDGLVGVSSCKIPGKTYGSKPTDRFFLMYADHLDGTGTPGGPPLEFIRNTARRA